MTLDLLEHLRDEADLLRTGVADAWEADPAASVPTCPDWTADDLLWHVAVVFRFWDTVMQQRAIDDDDVEAIDLARPSRPGDHAGLVGFYDTQLDHLVTDLEQTSDDVPLWTWAADPADHTVGFVRRRMVHETLIHRIDAELTAGRPPAVDPELAADGVSEALQHFRGYVPPTAQFRPDGPVGRLHADDTGDDWLFRVGSYAGFDPRDDKTYAAAPVLRPVPDGAPRFCVSAPARDLDAWLWNRPASREISADGDHAAFERFAAVLARPLG